MQLFRKLSSFQGLISFAGMISTVVSFVKDVGMEALGEFFIPIYTFLGVLFAGWFIMTVAARIDAVRPTRKFAMLESRIFLAFDSIQDDVRGVYIEDAHATANLESLRHKLAHLGVGLPQIREPNDLKELHKVLFNLLVYSKDGRVTEARSFTTKWI